MMFRQIILFVFIQFALFSALAQNKKQVEVLHSDELEVIRTATGDIQKLKGDVRLRHNESIMTCDSAFLYRQTNTVDAFGNVRIIQGSEVTIAGDSLKYNGNDQKAALLGNASMRDRQMLLTTKRLNYDMREKIATYSTGATLVNDQSTLTSEIGYYHSNTKNAFFKKDVVLTNPEYTLKADTLLYNIESKIAYFFGPTIISSKESTIYCEDGWYNTVTDIALFAKNTKLENPPQWITADTLFYDRLQGLGRAFGNIKMVDTSQSLIIESAIANYYERQNTIIATQQALMTNIISGDSLFLTGDTLKSVEDTITKIRNLYAYHNVKIFKSDMQGICDSLTYNNKDSVLTMYKAPVLWSDNNQFLADTILIYLVNNKIDRISLLQNAFLASKNDTLVYNQIKGKYINGIFEEDTLRRMVVDGNGLALYFLQDESNAYIGANRTECTNMVIKLFDNKVDRINCTGTPSGKVNPMKQLRVEELILEGFVWHGDKRPRSKYALLSEVPLVEEPLPPSESKEQSTKRKKEKLD